jgi:hypothetical protein
VPVTPGHPCSLPARSSSTWICPCNTTQPQTAGRPASEMRERRPRPSHGVKQTSSRLCEGTAVLPACHTRASLPNGYNEVPTTYCVPPPLPLPSSNYSRLNPWKGGGCTGADGRMGPHCNSLTSSSHTFGKAANRFRPVLATQVTHPAPEVVQSHPTVTLWILQDSCSRQHSTRRSTPHHNGVTSSCLLHCCHAAVM